MKSQGFRRRQTEYLIAPKLGYPGNNFLVVNADNFSDDNHKGVLVTTALTTRWQISILCVSNIMPNKTFF